PADLRTARVRPVGLQCPGSQGARRDPQPRRRAVLLVRRARRSPRPADLRRLARGRARLWPLLRPGRDLEARRPARRAGRLDLRAGGRGLNAALAEGIREQAELLEDQGAERQGKEEGKGAAQASAVLVPEALSDLGALRPAARGRRRAGLLGDPEGAVA